MSFCLTTNLARSFCYHGTMAHSLVEILEIFRLSTWAVEVYNNVAGPTVLSFCC